MYPGSAGFAARTPKRRGQSYEAVTPSGLRRHAHLYDTQPYRAKTVDPELLAFLGRRVSSDTLSILEVRCSTGNQLLANRTMVPHAQLVGFDRSLGMLRQAQSKPSGIAWVQADGAILPFRAQTFDFVTCQHALHHVQDKAGMLGGASDVGSQPPITDGVTEI